MGQLDIEYLECVVARSKETRRTLFGQTQTAKAKAAECVLVAFAPALIQEIVRLRTAARSVKNG